MRRHHRDADGRHRRGRRVPEAGAALRILFLNGFPRSGTTVSVDALALAAGGTALTVGHLAEQLGGRRGRMLARLLGSEVPVDRGVDGRLVTASMPEEYGWYLFGLDLRTRRGRPRSFRFRERQTGVLRQLAGAVVAGSTAAEPVAVLKNPWDTGSEGTLLSCFPEADVVLLRRSLAGIEDSMRRSVPRYIESNGYFRALMGNDLTARLTLRLLARTRIRATVLLYSRWRLRLLVLRLIRTLPHLPPARVAFLSYDELLSDPMTGAAWASHLLDAERLAAGFSEAVFRGGAAEPRLDPVGRVIDRAWDRAWDRARRRQLAAGILPAPR